MLVTHVADGVSR